VSIQSTYKSCLRLSRLVPTGPVDESGVSASEDACTYSCHLVVHIIYDMFDSGFVTLVLCCLPRSSALLITSDTGVSCDGVDRPAAAARPCGPSWAQDKLCLCIKRGNADLH
jgi:hypothetical protein